VGAALRPAFSQDTPSDIIAKACQVRRKISLTVVVFCKFLNILESHFKEEERKTKLFLSWKYSGGNFLFFMKC
jgi:hypothetical protein